MRIKSILRRPIPMVVGITLGLVAVWALSTSLLRHRDAASKQLPPTPPGGRSVASPGAASPVNPPESGIQENSVRRGGTDVGQAIEKKIAALGPPESKEVLIRKVTRTLIDLDAFRHSGIGSRSGINEFFRELNENKTDESRAVLDNYRRVIPLLTIIGIAELTRDVHYSELMKETAQNGLLQQSLNNLLAEGSAMLGKKEIRNLYGSSYDEIVQVIRNTASDIETEKAGLSIDERFLSDAFLTLKAVQFIEPLLQNQLRELGGEDILPLIDRVQMLEH